MEEKDIVEICRKVLERLFTLNYERIGGSSDQRLIFPNKFPSAEKAKNITDKDLIKNYTRISEQELRFLFVEEFLTNEKCNKYFYSVETPTEFKYTLGDSFEKIKCGEGRSASTDMSIFTRGKDKKYNRFFNIEFKNQNSSRFSIGKDILKLVHEKQSGAFIILLKNTNSGTLCNKGKTGVLDKLKESFGTFKHFWQGDAKFIQLIILSLEQKENKILPVLISRKITRGDLNNLDACFVFNDNGFMHINKVLQ